MKIRDEIINTSYAFCIGKKLVQNGYKVGDEIWAAAYSLCRTKESNSTKCQPVKGILSDNRYGEPLNPGSDNICYFVPYGKKGKPSYSKCTHVESRQYATTEAEAIELYNDAIQATVNELLQLKTEVEKDFIR